MITGREGIDRRKAEWLSGDGTGDTLFKIGGRATDLINIATSLRSKIKEAFQINKVPTHIIHDLCCLEQHLELAEEAIEALVFSVQQEFET